MKQKAKPSTSPGPTAVTEGVGKPAPNETAQVTPPTPNELGQGIDRPGFDLGGSTGKTHAGTGLGLGTDAFDTPGERSLPGRKLDNKPTIPRWSGPKGRDTAASVEKAADTGSSSTPQTKKTR